MYVSDAERVEPCGKTRRMGINISIRYQMHKTIFTDANINYAQVRSIENSKGENYISLVQNLTSTGGLNCKNP